MYCGLWYYLFLYLGVERRVVSTLNIYLEERFYILNGIYYSQVYHDKFWSRYLSVFSSINVVARGVEINCFNQLPKGYKPNHLAMVHFIKVPNYQGLFSGFIFIPYLFVYLFYVVLRSDLNILRLPGMISIIAGFFSIVIGRKFAVELVGDPYEVFSSGVGGKTSGLLRFIFTGATKKIISKSNAVAYVTKEKLQKMYVASPNASPTNYSSIVLDKSLILSAKSIRQFDCNYCFNILMVGSLDQRYKGFDLVFLAYHKVRNKFHSVKLFIIGDGIYRQELEDLANRLKIRHHVCFLGKVSRDEVLDYMDTADLFIMPSRTEGLPRALIEAMARGVPAIGSNVGGIPELLSNEFLFEKENVFELVQQLYKVIPDYSLRLKMSRLNLKVAQDYRSDLLEVRRNIF